MINEDEVEARLQNLMKALHNDDCPQGWGWVLQFVSCAAICLGVLWLW